MHVRRINNSRFELDAEAAPDAADAEDDGEGGDEDKAAAADVRAAAAAAAAAAALLGIQSGGAIP